jgi:hypothetical protein
MSSYWFVVTGWNDDQGQRKRRMDYWIDGSSFSVEQVVKGTDQEKAGILQPIQTVDVPEGSFAEKIEYLNANYPERLLRGVMLGMVHELDLPVVPNGHGFVFVDFDVIKTNQPPPEDGRQIVGQKYGVKVWRLRSPIPVD